MAFADSSKSSSRLRNEVIALAGVCQRVWELISIKRRWALGLATLILVVVSAGNTTVALLLGTLVDSIQKGLVQKSANMIMYIAAGKVLLSIALIYVIREILN